MSEAKFTKGEWQLEEADFDGEFLLTTQQRMDNSQVEILTIDTSYLGDIGQEQKANAHLIAAAPEMYDEIECDINGLIKLLQSLDRYSNDYLFYSSELERKQQLLAKARGEQ